MCWWAGVGEAPLDGVGQQCLEGPLHLAVISVGVKGTHTAICVYGGKG